MTPVSKRLALGLALSVALNLLCVGVVIGRRLHGGQHPWPPPGAELGREPWRHPRLRAQLERLQPDLAARREAMRGARLAVRDALLREPFERSQLEAALGALRVETGKNQEVFHRALLEAAVSGDPAARKAMVHAFEAGGGGMRAWRP